jgi:hypothetical protein
VRADKLRVIVEAVVRLTDFLDHTAMLALLVQRSIDIVSRTPPRSASCTNAL